MNLIESLSQKSKILELVEQNEGELTDITEMDLTLIDKDIAENVDSISRYYLELQNKIETQPKQVREFASHLSKKLNEKKDRLFSFLRPVLKMNGKLKTEFSSLNLVSRKSKSVVVDDFDLVCRLYPECVVVTTSDDKSERVIKILKSDLSKSEKYEKCFNENPLGWHFEEREVEYLSCKHLSP